MLFRLGTRASALARWQADWVADRLREQGHTVEMVLISTQGDKTQNDPTGGLGGVGVFTKELQRALLENRIDLAVHSLKDLPTDRVEGLILTATPDRESVADALISREGHTVEQLPQGATVGTGSIRRRAQLLRIRPDLQMADLRGNVDTRLRKLQEGQYDAIVLAEAGLKRLGFADRITQVLTPDMMLPAVGQGALGIESREQDSATRTAVSVLDHAATHAAVLAERALLAGLRGGCLAPVGAWGRIEEDAQLRLTAKVIAHDGSRQLVAEDSAPSSEAADLGRRVAEQLLAQGAADLIAAARTA
jgi:hydroxymethylbilane synthase